MRKQSIRKAVGLFGLPLFLFGAIRSTVPYPNLADLNREAHRLAGSNAVDCGIVGLSCVIGDKEQVKADGCAVVAYKAGKPFRLHFDFYPMLGVPSHQVILMTPQKEVYELGYQEAQPGYRKGIYGFFARGEGPTPLKVTQWQHPKIQERGPNWKQLVR